MPNERAADPGHRGSTIGDLAEAAGPGSVDGRHLLLIGAGPGLGMAVARRFAVGGYQVTLVARSRDGLGDLAGSLADTGAKINTIAADASDPDRLGLPPAVANPASIEQGPQPTDDVRQGERPRAVVQVRPGRIPSRDRDPRDHLGLEGPLDEPPACRALGVGEQGVAPQADHPADGNETESEMSGGLIDG